MFADQSIDLIKMFSLMTDLHATETPQISKYVNSVYID